MNKDKKVTNLLDNIGKIRDVLDTKDFKEIKKHQFLIEKTKNDIIRQVKKYIESETHQTDFNHEDIRAISDGLYDVSDKLIKMRYSNLYKTLTKETPVTMEHFNSLCFRVADTMHFDRFIRQIANEYSFWAVTMWLWSQTDYRKDIMTQIEEHLRSFL